MLLHLKRTESPENPHSGNCSSVAHKVRHLFRRIVFRRCRLSEHLKSVQLSPLQTDYSIDSNNGTVNAHAASAMMNSFSRVLVMLFSSLCCISASAESLYVRAGASGASDGTSWANAWPDFSSVKWGGTSLGWAGVGDTIWVAGGTYGGFEVKASGVTIKRATASSHGNDDGWNNAYDTQVKIDYPGTNAFGRAVSITQNDTTIDGQTWGGIWIQISQAPARDQHVVACIIVNANNTTLRYLHLTGPIDRVARASRGIGTTISGPRYYGCTIQYCEFDHLMDGMLTSFMNNFLIEYCKFHTTGPSGNNMHDNCVFLNSCDNGIFRYNELYDYAAEGLYFSTFSQTTDNWQIYGNVWRDLSSTQQGRAIEFGSDHCSAPDCGEAKQYGTNWYIFNNTFVNILGWPPINNMKLRLKNGTDGPDTCPGGQIFNNIFYNCNNNGFGTMSHGYNSYGGSGPSAGGQGGVNDVINGTDPFVNLSGKNFRLSGPTAAGKPLGSTYNIDPDKKTRGADGMWDRGAYEYGLGGGSTNAMISVSPNGLDFGSVMVGETNSLTFTVQNFGSGTLVGTSSVPSSVYSIFSGQAYSLTNGQISIVTVQFSPIVAGAANQTVTFTGGGDATAMVSGVGTVPPPSGDTFNFEASAGGVVSAPFIVTNGYIYQASETSLSGGGRAVYSFTLTNTGTYGYGVRVLVNAPNEGANSFFVDIDAEPQDPVSIWDIPVTSGFEQRNITWRGLLNPAVNKVTARSWYLGPGTHQLIIRGREAGAQLKSFYIGKSPTPPPIP
jgi:hypothetical protein